VKRVSSRPWLCAVLDAATDVEQEGRRSSDAGYTPWKSFDTMSSVSVVPSNSLTREGSSSMRYAVPSSVPAVASFGVYRFDAMRTSSMFRRPGPTAVGQECP